MNFKKTTLKPILESESGIHLTAYLVNRGDLIDLKSQLNTVINEAYEWLNPALSIKDINKFLEPLDALSSDTSIFKQIKGNIGIFRNMDSFRVLNIPVSVEPSCQVATSFHVKPLLRWIQGDQEFLLLNLEFDSVHLYQGSQDSFKLIESIKFPEYYKQKKLITEYLSLDFSNQQRIKDEETLVWLNHWISNLTKFSKPKLFISGDTSRFSVLRSNLKLYYKVNTTLVNTLGQQNVTDLCTTIRKALKAESQKNLEKALLEFRFADEDHHTSKNIFQIARAVVKGKVRKLIVTDEINIFGKIDKKSGGLTIHPFDLDHEDDDILDDLAQMVLSQGGEVVIAKRNEIPKGRPILALMEDEGVELEKSEAYQYEFIEERFG